MDTVCGVVRPTTVCSPQIIPPGRGTVKMRSLNVGVVTVLGLILAAVGILAPIGWDWYKTSSALELHHVANIKLVERASLPEKLQLTYDGRSIPTLSRHTFSLINTGRTPILKDDLKLAPTITFEGDVELLEVVVDAHAPRDLDIRFTIESRTNSVVVSFPLLNPGDQIQFGVLLAGSTSDYTVKGRIVGITEIEVVDRVEEFLEVKEKIHFTVYFVGIMSLMLYFVIFGGGIPALIEDARIKAAIARNEFDIPKSDSKEDYIKFIRATFTRKTKKLQPLTDFIEGLPSDVSLGDDYHDQIRKMVIEFAKKQNNLSAFIILLSLASLGSWYVLSNIL